MMRVLGIDPGSTVTGWGVVEEAGARLRCIASGCIRLDGETPHAERLGRIFRELSRVMADHGPELVALEEVFVSRNVQSALKLGQARGAAMVAAAHAGLAVHEYTAVEVKKAVVGYGQAEKGQMQAMVTRLLALDKSPAQDAADALSVAICHLHRGAVMARLGGGR